MSELQTNSRPYHHGNLRQALLQAAEMALEARGATDLSLRELSREVGVSHTSPRRHFADKQALWITFIKFDHFVRHIFKEIAIVADHDKSNLFSIQKLLQP